MSDRAVEYSLWMAVVSWQDHWTGYLIHHFDNGTFDSADDVLDLIDRWATLTRSGELPWSDGSHPGNVLAAIVDRAAARQEPLVVYMPQRVPDGFEWPSGRTRSEVVEQLRRYERSPDAFEPDVDELWGLAEGVANKLAAYAELPWPRWRPRSQADRNRA